VELAGSLWLDVRELYHLAPLLGVFGDEPSEVSGRTGKRTAACSVSKDSFHRQAKRKPSVAANYKNQPENQLPSPFWRDKLPIHPAAELFPMMSKSELRGAGRARCPGLGMARVCTCTPLPARRPPWYLTT
jgi:hypothetical protein